MSTKIYTGFKLEGHSLDSAVDLLVGLKPEFRRTRIEQLNRWLASRVSTLVDRVALNKVKLDPGVTPFDTALKEFNTRRLKVFTKKLRDPAIDFEVSVVLFKHPKGIFGVYFSENKALSNVLLTLPEVLDFSYWDNSDPPDRLSGTEWVERKAVWKEIFSESWVPSEAGLSLTLLPEIYDCEVKPQDLLPFVPSISNRLQDLALDLAFSQYLTDSKLPSEASISEVTGVYGRFTSQYLISEQGLLAMKNLRDDLSSKIPLTIGVSEMLNLSESSLLIK